MTSGRDLDPIEREAVVRVVAAGLGERRVRREIQIDLFHAISLVAHAPSKYHNAP